MRRFTQPVIWLLLIGLFLTACTPAQPSASTETPQPTVTPVPGFTPPALPETRLNVEEEALRGKQVTVWYPWFGAEATLLESQIAQFNKIDPYGIVVVASGKSNYSELYQQTDVALKDSTNPNLVIGLPEHALGWDEHVVDLNQYVEDPLYGIPTLEMTEYAPAVWSQDEVNGKRYGMPAQRTARFIIYNESWARELGFSSPPQTASEFDEQACAANRALRNDADSNNDSLGGWLVDTNAATPLAWMFSFGGGVQEEKGYRILTPKNIDAFKFLKQLQQKSCAWVASQEINVYDRFASRQALFATASLEELVDQSRAFGALGNKDEWTVLPFPGSERTAFIVYGSSYIVFNSDEETQLASWLFIRWMLTSENQVKWIQSTGLFPLRSSTLDLLADYSASHPQWAEAVQLLPQGQKYPQLSSWRVVKFMMSDAFRDMFDVIRHPDITDGQISLILRQMEETAQELNK